MFHFADSSVGFFEKVFLADNLPPIKHHANYSSPYKTPKKEISFDGIFLLKDGKLQVLDKSFLRPNGLAFAPGEKFLYVNDSFKKTIMRFEVRPDDTLANGQVFIDMNGDDAPGVPDGMKVDLKGNVYCTGPGGVWIISPEGKHLATIKTPERITNLAFGNADGKMLFLTGRTGEGSQGVSLEFAATAASHIRLWLACRWGCRDQRPSRE